MSDVLTYRYRVARRPFLLHEYIFIFITIGIPNTNPRLTDGREVPVPVGHTVNMVQAIYVLFKDRLS